MRRHCLLVGKHHSLVGQNRMKAEEPFISEPVDGQKLHHLGFLVYHQLGRPTFGPN